MRRLNYPAPVWIASIVCILAALVVVSLGVRIPAAVVVGLVLFSVGIVLLGISYILQRRLPPVQPEEVSDIPLDERKHIVDLHREKGFASAVRALREKHPGLGLSEAVDAVKLWSNCPEVTTS